MGFAGYNLVWFVIRPPFNVSSFSCELCGPFLNSYIYCPAVSVFALLWVCGLFCFDFVYLSCFASLFWFICHSPSMGFINLFFLFCILFATPFDFPCGFFVSFMLSVMVFTLPFIWALRAVSNLLTLFACFSRLPFEFFNVTSCTL